MDKKSRKGQEEMLGFVFVVLLITVVVIAFVFFSLVKKQPIERENLRVNNLLNAMLHYTTECDKKALSEVILGCEAGESICLDKGGACSYSQAQVESILATSLKGDYLFKVEFFGNYNRTVFEVKKEGEKGGECPGKRTVLKAISIFPVFSGHVSVELYSCPIPEA